MDEESGILRASYARFQITVDNRDYHYLSQLEIAGAKRDYHYLSRLEIAGGKRIYQHLSGPNRIPDQLQKPGSGYHTDFAVLIDSPALWNVCGLLPTRLGSS